MPDYIHLTKVVENGVSTKQRSHEHGGTNPLRSPLIVKLVEGLRRFANVDTVFSTCHQGTANRCLCAQLKSLPALPSNPSPVGSWRESPSYNILQLWTVWLACTVFLSVLSGLTDQVMTDNTTVSADREEHNHQLEGIGMFRHLWLLYLALLSIRIRWPFGLTLHFYQRLFHASI